MVQVPGAPGHKIVIMSVNPTNHHISNPVGSGFLGGEGINELSHKSGANSTGHDNETTAWYHL